MDERLNVLLGKLRKETDLRQERISLDSLRKAFAEGRMAYRLAEDGSFAAIAIVQPILACIAQVEVGPIWVDPSYRGKDLGLVYEVIRDAMRVFPGESPFIIATCDAMVHIAGKCGFLHVQWLTQSTGLCQPSCRLYSPMSDDALAPCRFRTTENRKTLRFFAPIAGASGL
jgi:hypothetical protein